MGGLGSRGRGVSYEALAKSSFYVAVYFVWWYGTIVIVAYAQGENDLAGHVKKVQPIYFQPKK